MYSHLNAFGSQETQPAALKVAHYQIITWFKMKKLFFLCGLFLNASIAMAQDDKLLPTEERSGEMSNQRAVSLDIFSQDTLGIRFLVQGKTFQNFPLFRPTLSYNAQFFEPALNTDKYTVIHGLDAGFSSINQINPSINITTGLRLGYSEVPGIESEKIKRLISSSFDVGFQTTDLKNSRFFELGQTFKCSDVQYLSGETSLRSRPIGKDRIRFFSLGVYMRLSGIFF